MSNKEKYDEIFMRCLELDKSQLDDNLLYNSIPNWDSVGHMNMISAIEDAFDIMLDTEDIIDFNSYRNGMAILKKYDIEI